MKYSIGNQIGDEGGFGSVHVCSSETGEKFAVKILQKMDKNSVDRFTKEIRLIMKLSHPNIIKIIVYNFESEKEYYIGI